jgi:large subunit ribosomal protein L24
MHIRKGDTVEVVSGDDSGSRGTVLSVDRKNGKVVIEGINKVYKHVRRGHPKSHKVDVCTLSWQLTLLTFS